MKFTNTRYKIQLSLFFILCSIHLFGQRTKPFYHIIVNDHYFENWKSTRTSKNSKVQISIHYKDGSSEFLVDQKVSSGKYQAYDTTIMDKEVYKEIDYFKVYTYLHFRNVSPDEYGIEDYERNLNNCSTGVYLYKSKHHKVSDMRFVYSVSPVLELYSDNEYETALPTHSKRTIKSNLGFTKEVYNWEYVIAKDRSEIRRKTDSDWKSLPQFAGKENIFISALDLEGETILSHIGKVVGIRQVACDRRVKSKNFLTYDIVFSSPHITAKTTKNATCYLGNDGEGELYLSRELFDAEMISLTARNKRTGGELPSLNNITKKDIKNNRIPISGLEPGDYQIEITGWYNGINTYSNVLQEDVSFTVTDPKAIEFDIVKSHDIYCHGGNDGSIDIKATGGSGSYKYQVGGGDWLPFTNGAESHIGNLTAGTHKIKVMDSNGCIAKDIVKTPGEPDALGDDIVLTEILNQPLFPLELELTENKQPTFYSGTNGQVTIAVSGGTPIKDTGKYYYKWVDEKGEDISHLAEDKIVSNKYYNTLSGIGAGKYYLTIYDQNYDQAVSKQGCTTISEEIIVDQPEVLKASIELVNEISCNNQNIYSDPSGDGALRIIASGGIQFKGFENNRQPYKYFWKKKQADGTWKDLPQYSTDTATGLDTGTYAVNIEDKNGIRIGTYVNNVLSEQKDITYFLAQPELLKVSLSKTDICTIADGTITSSVSGGVAPYSYTWSNGARTSSLSNIKEGKYSVLITDAKGCQVKAEIVIYPSLKLETLQLREPSFAGGSNGEIKVKVFDGLALVDGSYTFSWFDAKGTNITSKATGIVNSADNSYTLTLSGVSKGKYKVRIEDARYSVTAALKDCYSLEREIELSEPDPLVLTFELVKPISCHTDNEFLEQGQESDAILKANVTGGRPFALSLNNGLPYKYTWKKQQTDGSWKVLDQYKTETITKVNDGVYAVNIEDSNGIVLGKYVDNLLVEKTDSIYKLVQPEKLVMSLTPTNECHNRLGWINVEVKGGTAPYTYQWSNGAVTKDIKELKAGKYSLTVIDSRGCIISASTEILAPVEVDLISNIEPTFYKGTNGELTVRIHKGKVFSDGSYKYQWTDKQGKVLNKQVVANTTKEYYELKLKGIGKGEYFLTVWDGHDFSEAINQCFIVDKNYLVTEPDPIVVKYEVVNPISCNLNNIYGNEVDSDNNGIRDEAQDGALRVVVTGGRAFNKGENNDRPYKYTWKKQQKDGTWQELYNLRTEQITNLSDGNYAVNVEDRNGIVLGKYTNNALESKVDSLYYLVQPKELTLRFEKSDSKCQGDLLGRAKAIVSGGIGPYTYQWSNGATTSEIKDLVSMPYYLIVYDSKGCRVEGVVQIEVPEQFKVQEKVEQLKCHNGSTASIEIQVTGGVLPYTYKWNNGATTNKLSSLEAGVYKVEVKDALGCGFIKEYTISNPEEFTFSLGEDVTLCEAQTLSLDITIADQTAKYKWTSTNGFSSTSSKVELREAGEYTATIISSQGCIATSKVTIKRMNVSISSEFLISTQAYVGEEVMIVNVSKPKGDRTTWLLPEGVKVIEETDNHIKLVFDEIGEYEIGLREHQGDCYQTFYKKVIVEEDSGYGKEELSKGAFIEDFIIAPVPNKGEFTVYVKLAKSSPINLRLVNYISPQVFYRSEFSGDKKYEIPVKVNLASGMYILILETGSQTISKKIIIL